ncbi:amino acid kinase family protein [Bacillus sp. OxB-1]|uniref:amino acid kinase family protein n=1 Tax=Bacillus sp. (strain OxB-1) TaxID=98228 RepID=UPI001E305202|nr:aspartate kinase [Bacillus sp. OxB-1]
MSRRKLGVYMIVQKFGGIAMRDEQMRAACIEHIREGLNKYHQVLVVVSAIGRMNDPYSTDSLLQLTPAFSSDKKARDLAASCGELIAAAVLSAELKDAGISNFVLHGRQAGVTTSGDFGDAAIESIDTSTILDGFQESRCLIIPGFQGVNDKGEVMTLGRGGSDLTAIALGAALQAHHVTFYKDVPGVMTDDPKKVATAYKLDKISLSDFLSLLDCEKPIIQKRAALHALDTKIPLYIRGIANPEEGTWVLP